LTSIVNHLQSFIDRRLNREYIRMICLMVLVVYLATMAFSFATQVNGRTRFGPFLGADFGAFYDAGSIYNSYPHYKIYDRDLHSKFYQNMFPDAPADSGLPYVNAPFFVLLFPLLARLPYKWAYLSWLLISAGLFVAALRLLWPVLGSIPRNAWSTLLAVALSFMPFLVECLGGGQTTAFGFFFLALALRLDMTDRQFESGLALALCSYKPTLLLLIFPMLIITRRPRILLGLVAGCAFLALVSFITVGWQGCIDYVKVLLHFTNQSTSAVSGLRSWKYVDINSFFRLLIGGHTIVRWVMTLGSAAIILLFLVRTWWIAKRDNKGDRSLVWAITITWTLVLNIYLGIYDSSLIVLSVLLTTNVLYRREDSHEPALTTTYRNLLLLLYVVPWVTEILAQVTGIQLYTLVLAAFGIYQIRLRTESSHLFLSACNPR
jgi:hypothetical protein